MGNKKILVERDCEFCGKPFSALSWQSNPRTTCSDVCKKRLLSLPVSHQKGGHKKTDAPNPRSVNYHGTHQNKLINRINDRAKALHMSYGAYVAAFHEYKQSGILVLNCPKCEVPFRRIGMGTYRKTCPNCGAKVKTIIDTEVCFVERSCESSEPLYGGEV